MEDKEPENLSPVSGKGLLITFTPSKRKKTKKITVNLEGELTLINVITIFDAVNPLFSSYDSVNVAMNNVSSVDLSLIQCLYKIKSAHEANGKIVSIESEFPLEYKELVRCSGFLSLLTSQKLTA